MPTSQSNPTLLVRIGVEIPWPPRIKRPTFLSLPILQGLWVVAAVPTSAVSTGTGHLVVSACVPVSWLLARLLHRRGVLRAPTALTFLVSNSLPVFIGVIGVPINLQLRRTPRT